MSREALGPGGTLQRGVSHVSGVLVGKFGWTMELRRQLRDRSGAYAWVVDGESSSGVPYRALITARQARPWGMFWSVTEEAWDLADKLDAWLFAYFDRPQPEVLVFAPERYHHTDMRSGEPTYEFVTQNGVSIERWLVNPNLRVKQRRLG